MRLVSCFALATLVACNASIGGNGGNVPIDGGTPAPDAADAATMDARPTDPDATIVDGGPPDAGFTDTGFPDSGLADAGGMVTPPPPQMSTRSLTSFGLGSDPFQIVLNGNEARIDLTPLVGATAYRAIFDPYLDPVAQQEPRRVLYAGTQMPLASPRKLTFDVTSAVQDALLAGETTLVLTLQDMFLERASLDVLCDLDLPTPLPTVTDVAARHQDGDTMITYAERNSPLTAIASTAPTVAAARATVAPSAVDKVRYRVYRSRRPIDDFGDIIDAELVDEVPPLSGWGDKRVGFDATNGRGDVEVFMLPVEDLTPAAPGTGIYVRRHVGPAERAWYWVSYSRDGAESFLALQGTSGVDEAEGPGMTVLESQQTFVGDWVFSRNINLRLDFYVRWSPLGEHPTPSEPFFYRVGVPLDPMTGLRPAAFHLHAFGGWLGDWTPWYRYDEGGIMVWPNLQTYTSYTGFHEGTVNLVSWEEGTVQPYFWARNLSFMFDFVAPQYGVDTNRLASVGSSMGGAGTMFWGLRSGHIFAYLQAAVGNSIPAEDITFEFEEFGYGPLAWQARFSNPQLGAFGYPRIDPSDNVSVWDYFDSRWWLQQNPTAESPFMTFANAPNDTVIAWGPAWANAQAIYDARQPHQFIWDQGGHGQGTEPVTDLDFRRDQAVVAFTEGSLDDNLGDTPQTAPPSGQRNRWYRWRPDSIVDTAQRFEIELVLRDDAPDARATVTVTPRRTQSFRPMPGARVAWQYGARTGEVTADGAGLVTVSNLTLSTQPTRLVLDLP